MVARCLLELNAIQDINVEYFQQVFPGALGREGGNTWNRCYRYYCDLLALSTVSSCFWRACTHTMYYRKSSSQMWILSCGKREKYIEHRSSFKVSSNQECLGRCGNSCCFSRFNLYTPFSVLLYVLKAIAFPAVVSRDQRYQESWS